METQNYIACNNQSDSEIQETTNQYYTTSGNQNVSPSNTSDSNSPPIQTSSSTDVRNPTPTQAPASADVSNSAPTQTPAGTNVSNPTPTQAPASTDVSNQVGIKKNSTCKKSMSFRFTDQTIDEIEKGADKYSLSKQEFVAFALYCFVNELDKKQISKLIDEKNKISNVFGKD